MDYLSNFIRPELLVLVPVLYIAGAGLKKSERVDDHLIPLALGLCGVVMALAYVLGTSSISGWKDLCMAVFTAVTQGVLCAGASVYVNQLVKQAQK